MAFPTLPSRLDAPTTATDLGLKIASSGCDSGSRRFATVDTARSACRQDSITAAVVLAVDLPEGATFRVPAARLWSYGAYASEIFQRLQKDGYLGWTNCQDTPRRTTQCHLANARDVIQLAAYSEALPSCAAIQRQKESSLPAYSVHNGWAAPSPIPM